MKKTKIIASVIAVALVLNIIMPVMTVFANSSYTLTFSVQEGTNHTIKVEDERLYIDDGVVELRDNENNAIGTVSSTGENQAQIVVTDGPEGELNFGGNNFSLFYNGNPYNFGEILNSNQNFLVQDANNNIEGDGEGKRFYQVDFNSASYTIGEDVVVASVEGAQNYRNVSLEEETEIVLTGFNSETMIDVVRGTNK